MAKELLNDNSVQQLYDFPESGIMKKELCFIVCSMERKENNFIYVHLSDLKYKIENVILITPEEIKIGDYIMCKEFNYKYDEDVTITVTNFKKLGNNSLSFLVDLKEFKKDEFFDCYFIYKKDTNEFQGFNNETVTDIESKIKFEDSKIYLFHRLKKVKEKEAKYNKKISFISEGLGDNISNNNINNLSVNIPYCFQGKVIERLHKKLTIVINKVDKFFLILDLNKFHFDIIEGQYIRVSSAKYQSTIDNIVNLLETQFTKIDIVKISEEKIQRIYIKFTFFGELKNNKISKFWIELNDEISDEILMNKQSVYYMYDVNQFDLELFYFIQNVNLFYNSGFSREFSFFVYFGFLNEINVGINQIGSCAYEFLYYALDTNYLPKSIELKDKTTFKNFQTFGNKTRKKISFINIQIQNDEDLGYGNSFLVIKLCNKDNIKLYGTMLLNSIEFKSKKKYIFNSSIDEFLKGIHKEFNDYCEKGSITHEELEAKYLNIDKNISVMMQEELNKCFNLYKIKEEEHTFDYFDSLVIWNIFNYWNKNKTTISEMSNYFKIYNKVKQTDIKYVEKSMILVGVYLRLRESKIDFTIPELFFYDELSDKNPYKMAYKFQFSFIDKLTEFSQLFQPFLLLDSYFMDMICYKNLNIEEKNIKNGVISSYSISMIPLHYIKAHLKKSIKNYFFVIKRGLPDERYYYASVQTDNGVITYNEKILLKETPYITIRDNDKESYRKDYAFLLNLENMHENFSHNKESILNTSKSPTIYFNIDFNYSYVYDNISDQIGEAGALLESFICDIYTLEEMKKLKYEMGIYFEVDYFVQRNFEFLINSFLTKKNNFQEPIREDEKKAIQSGYKKMNLESTKSKDCDINQNNHEAINIDKENKHENKEGDKNEETVLLSRYNCVIITAKTLEELSEKIKNMKKKKLISPKNAVPRNDEKNFY